MYTCKRPLSQLPALQPVFGQTLGICFLRIADVRKGFSLTNPDLITRGRTRGPWMRATGYIRTVFDEGKCPRIQLLVALHMISRSRSC